MPYTSERGTAAWRAAYSIPCYSGGVSAPVCGSSARHLFHIPSLVILGVYQSLYTAPLPCPVTACLGTVRRAAQHCGLKEAGENEEWTVFWTDSTVALERLMEMKRFQVNRTAAQQGLLGKEGNTRLSVEQHVAG